MSSYAAQDRASIPVPANFRTADDPLYDLLIEWLV